MKAILALEDGTIFEGQSFTGECEGGGELIFNTSMGGYQELLTDPSYSGQMVCLTYPLIGNYGINPFDMESDKIHVQALLVKECCHTPSNWQSTMSLADFLVSQKIPGIEALDTRALTLHIRKNGAMRALASTNCHDINALINKAKALPTMQGQNLVAKVAPKKPYIWHNDQVQQVELNPNGSWNWQKASEQRKYKLLVYDFGIKWNILRLLAKQDFDMLIVPPDFSYEQAQASGAEAVFLSNGPGDPASLTKEIANIAKICDTFPVAGICLGHQLLGHALGGTTVKMKFGHHGCNHPVKDLVTGRIEISSQNHGFCVENPKLNITHINLNDGSLEGFSHPTKPIIAVQHHPEAAPGPNDSRYFFRRFKSLIEQQA